MQCSMAESTSSDSKAVKHRRRVQRYGVCDSSCDETNDSYRRYEISNMLCRMFDAGCGTWRFRQSKVIKVSFAVCCYSYTYVWLLTGYQVSCLIACSQAWASARHASWQAGCWTYCYNTQQNTHTHHNSNQAINLQCHWSFCSQVPTAVKYQTVDVELSSHHQIETS